MSDPIAYRTATPDDLAFILNSWLRSYRQNNLQAKEVAADTYYERHREIIVRLCQRSAVIVACVADTPTQIVGYVVFEAFEGPSLVMHYVYVKRTYRGLGVGSALLAQAKRAIGHRDDLPVGATHVTYLWFEHLRDRWRMWFNPYLLGLSA